jgi:hypothetical protein
VEELSANLPDKGTYRQLPPTAIFPYDHAFVHMQIALKPKPTPIPNFSFFP